MSEHCPLIGEQGELRGPTGDRYGAVWDSGLPALCMATCFRIGQVNAESHGLVQTELFASEEELSLVAGDTGCGDGIEVISATERIGHIDIDDGEDPENVLSHSQFSFTCIVESA